MKLNKDIKKIKELIDKYESIYIFSHENADGDSLGSSQALRDILKLNYPKKDIRKIGSNINSRFSFFNKNDKYEDGKFLAIILDTPNKDRVDGKQWKNAKEIIKIDHHPEIEDLGNINIVDTELSSSCELVYTIFIDLLKYKMNKEIASYIFFGLVTDTGRFRYSNVKSSTFIVLSKLYEYNFDSQGIYNSMLEANINEVKYRAYIQTNIIIEGNVAYSIAKKHIEKKFNLNNNEIGGYVYAMANIKNVKYWLYANYNDAKQGYRISIRSNDKPINEIAKKYNGGGHDKAAGAFCQNKKDIKKIIGELKNL